MGTYLQQWLYPTFEGLLFRGGEKFNRRILVIRLLQRNRMQRALTIPFIAAVASALVVIIALLFTLEGNYC